MFGRSSLLNLPEQLVRVNNSTTFSTHYNAVVIQYAPAPALVLVVLARLGSALLVVQLAMHCLLIIACCDCAVRALLCCYAAAGLVVCRVILSSPLTLTLRLLVY